MGWTPEPWYQAVQVDAAKLSTLSAAQAAAEGAGIEAEAELVRVPFPDLDAAALAANPAARLGDAWPPLERSIIILRAERR